MLKRSKIEFEHGSPPADKALNSAENNVTAQVYVAFDSKDQGDESGFQSSIQQAQRAEGTMWMSFAPPPDNYGGSATTLENFIVYLRGGRGESVPFNELKTDNVRYRIYHHGGAYTAQVVSECA